jgi:hypothetical protein
MSAAQLENLARDRVERIERERDLEDWLRYVVKDLSAVQVGIWRCPVGKVTCPPGQCGGADCECCENAQLWESPLGEDGWEPECGHCGRKALLVEVAGTFDYAEND